MKVGGRTSWVLFLLISTATLVRSTLVAYYGFDDASTPTAGLSGYCPNVVPRGTLGGGAKVTNTSCRFGSCLQPSGGYMDTGSLKVFQGSDTSRLSVSVWIRTPSSIGRGSILYKSGLASLATVLTQCSIFGCFSNELQCTVTFSTGQTKTVSSSSKLSGNTAYNVACIYNGQSVCLYLNGALQSCADMSSVFAEGGNLQIGSDGSQTFQGYIDEVKIYDHALSSSEISLINGATSANDQPSVLIEVNGAAHDSYSTQALTNATVNAVVQDYRQAFSGTAQNSDYAMSFVYSWEALSATCGSINLSSANTQNSTLSFLAVSSSTINICASDGEIARQATLTAFATASAPVLTRQPTAGIIEIPG